MQFNCLHHKEGTTVQLSRAPNEIEKEVILTFLGDRGCFTDSKEFFIKKHLEREDVLRYFKAYNLPFDEERVFFQKVEQPKNSPARPYTSNKNKYTMTFGCYKNKPLNSVPESYLKWLISQSADPELLEACQVELKERNTIIIFHK